FFMTGVYPMTASRFGLPVPGWLANMQLKAGLDLKGGVHLVLRVNTDDALRLQTAITSEQLREPLQKAGVTVGAITVTSPASFRVEGVPGDREAEFRRIAEEQASANFDRTPGGPGAHDFRLKPNIEADMRRLTMQQALDTIDRRVN